MLRIPFGGVQLALLAGSLATLGCAPVDAGTSGGSGGGPPVPPGELCDALNSVSFVTARAEPAEVWTPDCSAGGTACAARSIKLVVDPDLCQSATVTFASSDEKVVATPPPGSVTLHQAQIPLQIQGVGPGDATVTACVSVPLLDGMGALTYSDCTPPFRTGAAAAAAPPQVTATFQVHVLPGARLACSGTPVSTPALKGGDTLAGAGGLAGASISLPMGADDPDSGSFLWGVPHFPASIACAAADIVPPPPDAGSAGYVALGPAIAFGPDTKTFHREVPLSLPLNPALLPEAARWRHLRIAYAGPGFKTPRTIPVADPRIEKVGGQWAVTFKAPRLGTYQAVVATDAGTRTNLRKLTHRAVIGISMGGGGTAGFGFRHHDLFDVLAPLGGPVDWTWMLHYIETNHLAGFRPIKSGTTLAQIQLQETACRTGAECKPDETCLGAPTAGKCVLMPPATEPYLHPQTFNTWWYEFPASGNGGHFARQDYAQIFRDLALQYGNPNGDNLSPGAENLPAGVPPGDPSVQGDHKHGECQVWVDPLDGADHDREQAIASTCPSERCAHTLTLQGYFDDEYNPDGTFPVITVCDGTDQKEALSPYANTWSPPTSPYPLEVGLAVDYNGNGVRDELEPIIRAGHEPWRDTGTDGLADDEEPGYLPGVNDDPHHDDYDAQYNPTGTEKNYRYEPGEPFSDTGLDGVAGTKQQPPGGWQKPGDGYDVGEGDGKFTVSRGLQRFWDRDAHSIVRKMVAPSGVPGGELTDAALSRLDVWTDGGTRDLFNFDVDAAHLVGTFAARNRDVSYITSFAAVPGNDPTRPDTYDPAHTVYDDLQGVIFQRYGHVDPTKIDLDNGSGKHVGTASEIASRLQSALYFIGSRWREPELRNLHAESSTNPIPGASDCEISGNCTLSFTSAAGRTGPVGITLPPGYANNDLKARRYPVIYLLHGYGQAPQDLEAAIVFLRNWMNSPTVSVESRLPKAILVYVDGRCRVNDKTKIAECQRGTFFADSPRKDGAQDEQWWLELMDYIDQNYRTMGATTTSWTE